MWSSLDRLNSTYKKTRVWRYLDTFNHIIIIIIVISLKQSLPNTYAHLMLGWVMLG